MKRILSLLFIGILSICGIMFTGCGGEKGTIEGVNNQYLSIMSDYGDGNGYIDSSINVSKVLNGNEVEQDKSDIFRLLYTPYINISSSLIFGVAARQNKTLNYAIQHFNSDELSLVYKNLIDVKNSLANYNKNKYIFEESAGNLMFDELMSSAEHLISNCYKLNDSFAKAYFRKYAVDFTKSDSLNNGTLRDYLLYMTSKLSKISYFYETLNNKYLVQNGYPSNWFNTNLILTKDFLDSSNQIFALAQSSQDLYVGLNASKDAVREMFGNFQREEPNYDKQYVIFDEASKYLNLKDFLQSSNREKYISSLNDIDKSRFDLFKHFIDNTYHGHLVALENILNKLKGY